MADSQSIGLLENLVIVGLLRVVISLPSYAITRTGYDIGRGSVSSAYELISELVGFIGGLALLSGCAAYGLCHAAAPHGPVAPATGVGVATVALAVLSRWGWGFYAGRIGPIERRRAAREGRSRPEPSDPGTPHQPRHLG